ncbi:TIGR03032 family protein [Kordiimonas marina]|uniref:TIGR03032 family protein n=1 Tax=Kordiimonas marina TaxID=2872312 RepID=UPI0031BAD53C
MIATKPAASAEAKPTGLEMTTSRQFTSWLADMEASLAFTTYQAGKLFMLSAGADGNLGVFERSIERCMGLAVSGNSLYVSSLYQIWRFENIMVPGEPRDGFDACFTPQMSYVTGDLDVHDMAADSDGDLIFVNTLFGCLAKPSLSASFTPLWHPSFLSKLAPEDRCHLNGMAMGANGPEYVTAVSESDVADGWRDKRASSGVVIHVPTGEVVARGLSMPHSPRLKDGILYLLNSGTGEFGTIDPETGTFTAIAFCPGYARGLTFVGDYAVIGLSMARDNKTFQDLPLDGLLAEKQADPRCGLIVVDLKTGDTVHWVRLEGVVNELYDVALMPGIRRPSLVGFKSDEICRVIKVGDAASA